VTVTKSEFFSHIVNTDGGGGLGKTINEDMTTGLHKDKQLSKT